MSAAANRYSTRVDEGEPGMTRSAVVRFSTPHVAIVGLQAPRTIRLYELIVGAISAVIACISATWPATYCAISLLMPLVPRPSWKSGSPCSDQSDWWRCPEQPGRSLFHLAMKHGITPWRAQISLAAVLNSAALSAARSSESYLIAASYTPGPVSVWKPSSSMSNAARPSCSAWTSGAFSEERSHE